MVVLVVVHPDESPVTVQALSVKVGNKLQERPFRIGSDLENYYFRVRQLDGAIMRYETPDYYFLPIMRDLYNQTGEDESTATLLDVVQRVRSYRSPVDGEASGTLSRLLASYERSLALWSQRRCAQNGFVAAHILDGYQSDRSDTDSE
jgi:hypothetical protein